MSVLFSGSELVDIAIGIERSGAAFYDSLAKSAKNTTARDIYEYLAGEERKHIGIFQKMLAALVDHRPVETYTEEYDLYLKSLVGSAVFSDAQVAHEMAQKVASDFEAIQIALSAEKDSIVFYFEMRELVRGVDRDVVTKIIEEERSHLKQLSVLKSGLSQQ